jgi:predicted permease
VVSATVSRNGNFGSVGRTSTDLTVERDAGPPLANQSVFDVPAGPRFFETFGIALLRGRDFTFQDDDRAPKVAILSQAAAHRFFGDQNPVGQRIGVGAPGDTVVIGVVGDTKLNDFREAPSRVMYRPFLQTGLPRRMTFAVRTAGPPLSMLTALRREIDSHERNLPLFEFTTLEDVIGKSLAQERLFAALSSLFGLLALTLAAVGLYGVMAHLVSRRTREIGLRIALGAGRRSVLGLIIGQGMRVALIGLVAGLLAAYSVTRFITSQLYGISPTDPRIFIATALLLAAVALLACWLPAHRAAKVDPIKALRNE